MQTRRATDIKEGALKESQLNTNSHLKEITTTIKGTPVTKEVNYNKRLYSEL